MGGNGNLGRQEEVKSAGGIPGAPASVNAFMDLMQSTVTSVYASAASTASNIASQEGQANAKAGLASAATNA